MPSNGNAAPPADDPAPPPPDDRRHIAWLDEMWAPVREYHPAEDHQAAEHRRQGLDTFWGDEPTRGHLEVA